MNRLDEMVRVERPGDLAEVAAYQQRPENLLLDLDDKGGVRCGRRAHFSAPSFAR